MSRLLAFTQSLRFGGDDTVLIELIRAWPGGDRWSVVLSAGHPGLAVYRESLGSRAEVVEAPLAADGAPDAARFPSAVRTLTRVFAARAADAVLVSSGGFPPTPLTLAALVAARRARAPRLVLAVHNEPNLGSGLRALVRDWRGRLAARLCDARVSVSADCAAKVRRACGLPVAAILNGAAPRADADDPAVLRRELGASEDSFLIGAIGSLERRKGFRTLLEAFRIAAADRPSLRLALIGGPAEPDEEAELRRLAADPALGGRARLAGPRPRAWRYAAAFDVCVVPSLERESFGLAALDAMLAGRPVVASRVGGLPEVVADGETGVLAPPGDAAELARVLAALVDSPEKRRRLGEAGRRRAREAFSAERMAREYREMLLGTPK